MLIFFSYTRSSSISGSDVRTRSSTGGSSIGSGGRPRSLSGGSQE